MGDVVDAPLGLLAVGDVEDDAVPHYVAVLEPPGLGDALDPLDGAFGRHETQLDLLGRQGLRRPPQGVLPLMIVVGVNVVPEALGVGHKRVGIDAEQLAVAVADEGVVHRAVGLAQSPENGAGNVRRHALKLLLALAQRLFGALAAGDVLDEAEVVFAAVEGQIVRVHPYRENSSILGPVSRLETCQAALLQTRPVRAQFLIGQVRHDIREVHAQQFLAGIAEHIAGVPVDVEVAAVGIDPENREAYLIDRKLGHLQRRLGAPPFGDIGRDTADGHHISRRVAHRELDREERVCAVVEHQLLLALDRPSGFDHGAVLGDAQFGEAFLE